MHNQAVALHENDGGALARFLLHALELIADGKGQAAAGVDVADEPPCVIRACKRPGDDLAAVFSAGGEVRIDAVRMRYIGIQQGMEARLHRGAQRFHAFNMLRSSFCLGGTGLFHVLKVGRLAAVVEAAQRGVVKHRVSLVDFNVLQAETRGLDGHERIIQLGRSVAAAALHVVCPAAGSFGHAGKLFEPFLMLFDKFHVYFSFALAQLSLRETVRL